MLEAMLFGHEKGHLLVPLPLIRVFFGLLIKAHFFLMKFLKCLWGYRLKSTSIKERVITPLGGSREINVDVRVIATTNRDMMEEIRGGKFREDLYYRLNVFPIATLALSERVEDIIPIAMALLRKHSENEPFNFILSDQAANNFKRTQLAWKRSRTR